MHSCLHVQIASDCHSRNRIICSLKEFTCLPGVPLVSYSTLTDFFWCSRSNLGFFCVYLGSLFIIVSSTDMGWFAGRKGMCCSCHTTISCEALYSLLVQPIKCTCPVVDDKFPVKKSAKTSKVLLKGWLITLDPDVRSRVAMWRW